MRRHEDGDAFSRKPIDQIPEVATADRIDAPCGFVEEAEDLAGRHIERHIVNCHEAPEAFHQIAYLDRWSLPVHASTSGLPVFVRRCSISEMKTFSRDGCRVRISPMVIPCS